MRQRGDAITETSLESHSSTVAQLCVWNYHMRPRNHFMIHLLKLLVSFVQVRKLSNSLGCYGFAFCKGQRAPTTSPSAIPYGEFFNSHSLSSGCESKFDNCRCSRDGPDELRLMGSSKLGTCANNMLISNHCPLRALVTLHVGDNKLANSYRYILQQRSYCDVRQLRIVALFISLFDLCSI